MLVSNFVFGKEKMRLISKATSDDCIAAKQSEATIQKRVSLLISNDFTRLHHTDLSQDSAFTAVWSILGPHRCLRRGRRAVSVASAGTLSSRR